MIVAVLHFQGGIAPGEPYPMDPHISAHLVADSLSRVSDPSRERFRLNLARFMADKKITQAGLARRLDVSRVAVHAWIWGTCFPETARLLRLAQVLDVSVGMLLDDAVPTPPGSSSNEEVLLLDAFRRLPSAARLSLLADAYGLTAAYATSAGPVPA